MLPELDSSDSKRKEEELLVFKVCECHLSDVCIPSRAQVNNRGMADHLLREPLYTPDAPFTVLAGVGPRSVLVYFTRLNVYLRALRH
jgi:hypothetical protein